MPTYVSTVRLHALAERIIRGEMSYDNAKAYASSLWLSKTPSAAKHRSGRATESTIAREAFAIASLTARKYEGTLDHDGQQAYILVGDVRRGTHREPTFGNTWTQCTGCKTPWMI